MISTAQATKTIRKISDMLIKSFLTLCLFKLFLKMEIFQLRICLILQAFCQSWKSYFLFESFFGLNFNELEAFKSSENSPQKPFFDSKLIKALILRLVWKLLRVYRSFVAQKLWSIIPKLQSLTSSIVSRTCLVGNWLRAAIMWHKKISCEFLIKAYQHFARLSLRDKHKTCQKWFINS